MYWSYLCHAIISHVKPENIFKKQSNCKSGLIIIFCAWNCESPYFKCINCCCFQACIIHNTSWELSGAISCCATNWPVSANNVLSITVSLKQNQLLGYTYDKNVCPNYGCCFCVLSSLFGAFCVVLNIEFIQLVQTNTLMYATFYNNVAVSRSYKAGFS